MPPHVARAREQRPEDPHIADTLGWICYKKKTYLKAASLLKEAAEKLTENPIVQYHLGMAQYKTGDSAGAKASLQTALKLSANFSWSGRGQENPHRAIAADVPSSARVASTGREMGASPVRSPLSRQ